MRYFVSKQIHSCFASFSSEDVFLHREVSLQDILQRKYCISDGEVVESEKLGFRVYYAEPDKTFYEKACNSRRFTGSYNKTPEFIALIERYKQDGWGEESKWLKEKMDIHWKQEEDARRVKRQREGYVIPQWTKDMKPEEYMGGFSEKVLKSEKLSSYLESGGCHGYIGHSIRTFELDAYLEAVMLQLLSVECFAGWLTSTGGRHFGDSLEGLTFDEQRQHISEGSCEVAYQAISYVKKPTAPEQIEKILNKTK